MLRYRFTQSAPEGPLFEEPTDAEISALLGGKPVYSLRPEDVDGCHPESDIRDNVQACISSFREKFPHLDLVGTGRLEDIFGSRAFPSANYIFEENGGDASWKSMAYVLLCRPSKKVSFEQNLSRSSHVHQTAIVPCLSPDDLDLIWCLHEVGHIVQLRNGVWADNVRGKTTTSEPTKVADTIDLLERSISQRKEIYHWEEVIADRYALQEYRKRGGGIEGVNHYIHFRALAGFCAQPSQYFTAPQLSRFFSDDPVSKEEILNYRCVRSAYHELRFRTIGASILGINLDHISSDDMSRELNNIDLKFPCEGHELRTMIMRTREEQVSVCVAINNGTLFSELARVVREVDIDPFIRTCGEQILGAVETICPILHPDRKVTANVTADKTYTLRPDA